MHDTYDDPDVTQGMRLQYALISEGFSDHDIARIIKEPKLARAMLASIQPDSPSDSTPSWYTSTDRQLTRARRLWPGAALPDPPKEFAPKTKSEILLLHVPDALDSLWRKITLDARYIKQHHEQLVAMQNNIRPAHNKREYMKPVWLGFDYEHGRSTRPDTLWDQANTAASEVLSAVIQFPDWTSTWLKGAAAPNLPGYQHRSNGEWHNVLYLYWRQVRGVKRLEINSDLANCGNSRWSSPTVREC